MTRRMVCRRLAPAPLLRAWGRAGVLAVPVPGVVLVVVAMVLGTAGCGQDDGGFVLGVIEPSLNHLPYDLAAVAADPGLAGVQVRRFASGWEANEALVAGRIDAAILPFTYAWSDVAQGLPVRVAGFLERESDGIVTRNRITSLGDLEGRRIGVLRASTLEILAVMALAERGIAAELVPLRTPSEMTAALTAGDVDALSFYVPPILTLGDEFHVIHWYGDDHPDHPCCNLAVNTDRLTGRREQLKRLQAALAVAALRAESERDRAVALASERFGLAAPTAREALARLRFRPGREAAGRAFEQRAAAVMHELGYLAMVPDTSDVYLTAP